MGRGSVLVTGASTGIGEATALHLDEIGFRVYAGVRRPDDAERLRAARPSLVPVDLDVTDDARVAAARATIEAEVGGAGLAGVVNNAGVARGGPIEHLAIDEWRQQFEVNVFGQVRVVRETLPMVRAGRGRIVFIGSIAGRVSQPLIGPYSASKHAIEAIGDTLRMELAPWSIPVSIVEPGAVRTPIWDKGRERTAQLRDELGPEVFEQYREQVERTERAIEQSEARGVPARAVAEAVAHALTARRPRTRYLVGLDAKVGARLRRALPDRAFDAAMNRFAG